MGEKAKSGNVKREPKAVAGKEANPVPKEILKAGDLVRMTPATLKNPKKAIMSPRVLVAHGWPNEFRVRETFDRTAEGPCIELEECCLKRLNEEGNYWCGGHPMGLFEKVTAGEPAEREFRPGDSRASIVVPWLGELAGYEYRADEKKASSGSGVRRWRPRGVSPSS